MQFNNTKKALDKMFYRSKKHLLLFLCCIAAHSLFAQTPTLQQKLYYTAKVWGFAKYYHSNVNACNLNWDSVLISVLPTIRTAITDSAFNDAIDTMLAAAGPMTLSTTYFPDTLPINLKFNRDFNWMSAPIFRSDVVTKLDTIKNNFRPHQGCYAINNTYTTSYIGWLVFPFDSIELNINTFTSFPDEDHKLLMFMKYWNVVRYFYPYTYVMDSPWDSTLSNYILKIDTCSTPYLLYLLYLNIATTLNDAHAYGLTYSYTYQAIPGYYKPLIRLKYFGGHYVVIKSLEPGIYPGDVLLSVDGLTTTQWEDSLKQYCSSGNPSVMRRSVCGNILGRQNYGTMETLLVEDSTGATHTFTENCINPYSNYNFFYTDYYPNDSLNSILWTTMPCNIGYVNMGNLQDSSINGMWNDLKQKSAIIFDLRNYPNKTAWNIANLLYPTAQEFAKFTTPDVTYPGTFFWSGDSLGLSNNPSPYTGKVIILMDEETISQAEFSCMILGRMANSVKVGSQTAGADGNISYWKLSQDMATGFSTIGVFYPNGDSTQRIGIKPDSVVYPTRAGVRNNRDIVLEKALSIAGCNLDVSTNTIPVASVNVFPIPANEEIQISLAHLNGEKITIELTDVAGSVIQSKEIINNNAIINFSFNLKGLTAGMYFVTIKTTMQQFVRKIVKE